jgi:hypothetical protein
LLGLAEQLYLMEERHCLNMVDVGVEGGEELCVLQSGREAAIA